jgi:SAM-dependent methyltransferase
MLAAARRRAEELGVENVEFRELDGDALALPDGSVDGVLCRFGVMLMPDSARALAEIARVLRPTGRAALAVWAERERNDWVTVTSRAALELGLMERPDPLAPGPFRLADVTELRQLVEEAGLRVEVLEDVVVDWRAGSLDEWWATVEDMSPSLGALLASATPDEQAALRAGAEARLAGYLAADGTLAVPGLARALLAVRP